MTPTTLRALAARLQTQIDDLDSLAANVCVELQWIPGVRKAVHVEHLRYATFNAIKYHGVPMAYPGWCRLMGRSPINGLDEIITLVEREFPKCCWQVDGSPLSYHGYVNTRGQRFEGMARAPTPARALLAAYCLAKAELMEEEA